MKAYVMTRHGGPDVAGMRDMAMPQPGRGEVLLRVHAAGLNPVDYKIREGALKAIQRYPLPAIMGKRQASPLMESRISPRCSARIARISASTRLAPRSPLR